MVTTIYDFISWPFYAAIQRPRKRLRASREDKASLVSREGGLTYRSAVPINYLHLELNQNNICTLEQAFTYALKKHGKNRCLGSREIINEEDETQPNGKVFKKLVMGDYIWKTYAEVDKLAACFSTGLELLGLKPRDRIAIFADTRAEWLIAAMAAFRINLTVVTLYATLGDEAVEHGLNQTEVKYVLTTHDLLPKFKSILKNVPNVKTMIYMEDPLHKTEVSGFKEGVLIHSFCDVIATGNRDKRRISLIKGIC